MAMAKQKIAALKFIKKVEVGSVNILLSGN